MRVWPRKGRHATFSLPLPHDTKHLRGDMIKEGGERYGILSYVLGGRSSYQNPDGPCPDGSIEKWKPNGLGYEGVREDSGLANAWAVG
jgi:hypothetical protein